MALDACLGICGERGLPSWVVCWWWTPERLEICHLSFTSFHGHWTTYKHVRCGTQGCMELFVNTLLYPQAKRVTLQVVTAWWVDWGCFVKRCAPPDEVMGVLQGVSQEPFYDDSMIMQQMEGRLRGSGMFAVTQSSLPTRCSWPSPCCGL